MCKKTIEETKKKCNWYNLIYSLIEIAIIFAIVALSFNLRTIINLYGLVISFIFFLWLNAALLMVIINNLSNRKTYSYPLMAKKLSNLLTVVVTSIALLMIIYIVKVAFLPTGGTSLWPVL